MTLALILGAAALTYLSRAAALVFLPPPPPRLHG
jgi:branched-subunit amino acid transport protein